MRWKSVYACARPSCCAPRTHCRRHCTANARCGWSSASSSTWSTMNSARRWPRSEEHTSELQPPCNLVCRLLLEKKNPLTLPERVSAAVLPSALSGRQHTCPHLHPTRHLTNLT